MSVYIPGISKPISCYDCPCANGDRMRCQVAKRDFGFFEDTRPDWCPLIPIPEHGDLIDKQYAYQNTMMLGEHTRKIILKQINLLPVLIPADKEE